MLQAMRGKAASWIVKVLFILLIISFGAWGITDYINRSTMQGPAVAVGDTELDARSVSASISRELDQIRRVFGNLPREQLQQLGIIDQAVDQLVARSLLQEEAKRLGLVVSDELVRRAIQANPAFQNSQGQFDRTQFAMVLARLNYSESTFVNELRRDMASGQVVEAVTGPARVPGVILDQILKYRLERRVAEYATLPFVELPATVQPTDKDLDDFHKANPQRFTAPERRSISYAVLSAQTVGGDLKIGEEELRDLYAQRLPSISQPERRGIQQILISDEAKAKEIAAQAKAAGADFLALAEAAGQSRDAAILGDLRREELPAPVADAAFSLPAGGVTDPVKSDFGWHVIKVTTITPKVEPSFDEIRTTLEQDILQERRLDIVFERSNKMDELAANGARLEEIAAGVGVTVETLQQIDRRGATATEATPAQQGLRTDLARLAFESRPSDPLRMVELPGGVFAVVRVDSVTDAALRPLAEVRDQVVEGWRQSRRDAETMAKAQSIADAAKQAGALAPAAQGLTVTTAEPFTRDAGAAGAVALPASAISDLFAAADVDTIVVARAADGYVVARLTAIQPADPAAMADQRAALETQLAEAAGRDLVQQLQTALRARFPVRIDRQQVNSLY